jgi:hypothetical protein
VEGAPGEPLCRDTTDFRRLSAAKRELEEFEIGKARLAQPCGMCQLNAVNDLVLANRVE